MDGQEYVTWARILTLISGLGWAAWLDHKYRRVPNQFWITWAGPAIFLWTLDIFLQGGEWYVEVRVDYDEDNDNGEILEPNENNNDARYSELLRVKPDLAIDTMRVDSKYGGSSAQTPNIDDTVTILTELVVREDSLTLFGFSNLTEKQWFNLLVSVQGVGAKAALAIFSSLSIDQSAK